MAETQIPNSGRVAFITGVTGQDGSYLAEYLLLRGYTVVGMVRRTSTNVYQNIQHLIDHSPKFKLICGDMTDSCSLQHILADIQPDEIYNLAAQSFVGASWQLPMHTHDVTGMGAVRLFEAARVECPSARIYQAGSSEMFGAVRETPQRESTPFYPRSPYAIAKTTAHYHAVNFRESYGMFIANGILFNHESPRRGMEFVTQVVADGVAAIVSGERDSFAIGNTTAKRDWGFAGDYVRAMYLMLQRETPADYVIGTGATHSVQDLIETAFNHVGITTWDKHVKVDTARMRPAEVDLLLANPAKAKEQLGWSALTTFKGLVGMMVDARVQVYKASKAAS